ncbi:F-box protein At5g49610-like [Lycium barbarum]|uniref:F-box protein At5g49610-like n=1 Tax=Lycium barbarum TaxID=112863 RepID=UPI00293F167E|nr:F-box protein At5g49610-like [Lycium barbarum]
MVGFFCQAREFDKEYSEVRFFFSSRKSSEVIDGSLDESVNFLGRRMYIVASSNGFLLIVVDLENQRAYYVCNPVTRQHLTVPVTRASSISRAAVGFLCKVDDPEKDVIYFTIVRYALPWSDEPLIMSMVKIESFSSETNAWTTINLKLDVPLRMWYVNRIQSKPVGVIDGVFCWIDHSETIFYYDSVNRCFWDLELPLEMMIGGDTWFLGISDGALYYALCDKAEITVWCLESNIRSRDAVWVQEICCEFNRCTPKLLSWFRSFWL